MTERACAIVLLGPPASGKTTLGRSLAARGGFSVVEAGALILREVERRTRLGQALHPYVVDGALAPSNLVMEVISNALETTGGQTVLFDGVPRALDQMQPFLQLLAARSSDLCAVIVLALDLQTAIDRISRRLVCSRCGAPFRPGSESANPAEFCERCGGQLVRRSDDREDVVRRRFDSFEQETRPVIEFFRNNFASRTFEDSARLSEEELADRVYHALQGVLRPAASEKKRDSAAAR